MQSQKEQKLLEEVIWELERARAFDVHVNKFRQMDHIFQVPERGLFGKNDMKIAISERVELRVFGQHSEMKIDFQNKESKQAIWKIVASSHPVLDKANGIFSNDTLSDFIDLCLKIL